MNWIAGLIRVRKECTEIAWGKCEVLDGGAPSVLVLRYRFRNATMVTLHNFSDMAQSVRLKLNERGGQRLMDLIADEHSKAGSRGGHEIALDGYGYRWYRVGTADETLIREAY